MFKKAGTIIRFNWTVIASVLFCFGAPAVLAQVHPESLAPIELPSAQPTTPSLYPTDITHVGIGQEQQLLRPGFSYYLFQKLPSNLWFNITAEESQRFESNVFFTASNPKRDYVFRSMPNLSLGYEGWKKINIYCNYFAIKDIFVGHHQLTFPTTQSLSLGLRRDFTINQRTTFQFDVQARELWQSTRLRQFDYLPGMTLTRFINPHTVLFLNTILQLRGGQPFVAPTREIDPFYTIGLVYTKNQWMFSNVGTLVTNFRHPPFNDSVPPVSNNSIIYDFEISHPVPKMPFLVSFIRLEPIWNWNSHSYPGISGFDFRLFGGLRLTISKPAYHSSIESLKQQLKEFNLGPAGTPPIMPVQPTGPSAPEETPSAPSEETPPAKKPEQPKTPEPQYSPSEGPVSLNNLPPSSWLAVSMHNLNNAPQITPAPVGAAFMRPETPASAVSPAPVMVPASSPNPMPLANPAPAFIPGSANTLDPVIMTVTWTDLQEAAATPASPDHTVQTWNELQIATNTVPEWTDVETANQTNNNETRIIIISSWTEFQTASNSSPEGVLLSDKSQPIE